MQDRVDVQGQRISSQSAPTRSSTLVLFGATAAIAWLSWTHDPFNMGRFLWLGRRRGVGGRRRSLLQGVALALDGSADAELAYDAGRPWTAVGLPQLGALASRSCLIAGARSSSRAGPLRDARISSRLFADADGSRRNGGRRIRLLARDTTAREAGSCALAIARRMPRPTFLIALLGCRDSSPVLLVWATFGPPARRLRRLALAARWTPGRRPGTLSAIFAASPVDPGDRRRWQRCRSGSSGATARAASRRSSRIFRSCSSCSRRSPRPGLGFESAVGELLRAQPVGRPLADELRVYQLEVSTGARRSRRACSRLALRVNLACRVLVRVGVDARRGDRRRASPASFAPRRVSSDSGAARAGARGRRGAAREAGRTAPRRIPTGLAGLDARPRVLPALRDDRRGVRLRAS